MPESIHDISVIICAYNDKRWNELLGAITSVQRQTILAREIIVVIDHNTALLKRLQEQMPEIIAIENTNAKGASGARNSGVTVAQGTLVAFLDDDACAEPDWLERMSAFFSTSCVVGVGGMINPAWPGHPPRWFPDEFNWVIGCTYRGMPEENAAVRNLICANMAVRRQALLNVGGFRASFGNNKGVAPVHQISKLYHHYAGDEETELCIRITKQRPDSIWLYAPSVRVKHRVPAQRVRLRYFLWRCYDEGLGKAKLVQLHGAQAGLRSERTYVSKTLPAGIKQGVIDAFIHGDLTGLARAGAITIGLGTTITGYLIGCIVTKINPLINKPALFPVLQGE